MVSDGSNVVASNTGSTNAAGGIFVAADLLKMRTGIIDANASGNAVQLYEDVLPALLRWQEQGIHLALYSSGSEHAQRLLHEQTGWLAGSDRVYE